MIEPKQLHEERRAFPDNDEDLQPDYLSDITNKQVFLLRPNATIKPGAETHRTAPPVKIDDDPEPMEGESQTSARGFTPDSHLVIKLNLGGCCNGSPRSQKPQKMSERHQTWTSNGHTLVGGSVLGQGLFGFLSSYCPSSRP
ncbi:hypothetical protein ColTof3_04691 [Colletotrichum tofieldiae]|nr:hypothetical protein ColTof3_04691 [Colletotrichum tofieldiae]